MRTPGLVFKVVRGGVGLAKLSWAPGAREIQVEYPLDATAPLYRPTVADAIIHPIFFPAPKRRTSGETLPLDTSLQGPGDRSVSSSESRRRVASTLSLIHI